MRRDKSNRTEGNEGNDETSELMNTKDGEKKGKRKAERELKQCTVVELTIMKSGVRKTRFIFCI